VLRESISRDIAARASPTKLVDVRLVDAKAVS